MVLTNNKPLNKKFAAIISVIGHPLLTLSIFTIIVSFAYEDYQSAIGHSSFVLVGIFIPLTLKMYLGFKSGAYSNFDVSNKTQRQSWYIFAIIILLLVVIVLFVTRQPRQLQFSVLFSLILLVVSKIVNYRIKSSLHVSFNVFLSFLIIPMSIPAGLCFLAFTMLVAWARLTQKRHTMKEIIAGAMIGLVVGISSLYII